MSDHTEHSPVNSAKLLLPVVILGMLLLMTIMYRFGGDAGVSQYQHSGAAHATSSGH